MNALQWLQVVQAIIAASEEEAASIIQLIQALKPAPGPPAPAPTPGT
jgi:hypothetical protein